MKIYSKLIKKFKDQKGIAAVWVAIVLLMLLGFAALAIDVGYLYATKNELQNIADAAALAGAGELGQIYKGLAPADQQSYDFSTKREDIVASARGVVGSGKNKAGGKDVSIRDDDIIIFNINQAVGDLKSGSNFYTLPDAVRVIARRDASANGPIRMFFARIFEGIGFNFSNINADATAGLTTLTEVGPGEMNMPIGLSENLFPNDCKSTIKFSPTTSSCAGWHNFLDPINANAEADKLLGFIKDDPTIHGGEDDGELGECLETPCGEAWLDAYFDMNANQVPDAAYTPGVQSEISFFEFQGGTISSLFNGGVLEWAADGVTPVMDGGTTPKQVVLGDEKHPAPFIAIFDYFRFRDNFDWPEDGLWFDADDDPTTGVEGNEKHIEDPDLVWSGLVPVYKDEDVCMNPNTDLQIVGFAVTHVVMPNPPPSSTVTAIVDCNITFIEGRGGGGTSGNVKGTIPNLLE